MEILPESIAAQLGIVSKVETLIKPARFRALVRLLRGIAKLHGPRPILIQDSRISQWVGSTNYHLEVDMGNLVHADEGQNRGGPFSLRIVALDQDLKALASLVGASVVVRDRGDEYAFSGEHFEVCIQKAPDLSQTTSFTLPQKVETVGEAVTGVNWAALRQYVGNKRTVMLYTYSDQLEMIGVPGKSPFLLNPSARAALEGQAPGAVFVAQHFLEMAGELELCLSLLRAGDNYWLKTSSKPCLINNLTSYECLYSGCV